MSVISATWTRNSHSLFDYESEPPTVSVSAFEIVTNPMTCFRERDAEIVSLLPTGSRALLETKHVEHLCRFSSDEDGLVVEVAEGKRAKELWLVVRDLPQTQRCLTVGDFIKLGNVVFTVRQLVLSSEERQPVRLSNSGLDGIVPCVKPSEATSKVCRICLMEGEDDAAADPLIAPCSCKGSIEHVHVGCLRHWQQSKLNDSIRTCNAFKYAPLQCELCRTELPTMIGDDANPRPLVELPQPEPPFIVLESRVRGSSEGMTHVLSLADGKRLQIGRSHRCDIYVDDYSVSRNHATIYLDEGLFVIKDEKSKFGTLIAMQKSRRVVPGEMLTVQSGRTVLSLSVP